MGPKTTIIIAVAALSVAACSSDDDAATPDATDASDATPSTELTGAPEQTDAPQSTDAPKPTDVPQSTADEPAPTEPPDTGALVPTPVVGLFADAYDFQGGTPDPALLPVQPGEVEAHWYRTGDVLAVVYVGLDASVDACPGNSALVGGGFDFVSNAELPNGSCPDFPTRIENSATRGIQVCDGQVSYLTLIPADTAGQVFASIEKPVPDVQGVGLASAAVLDDPSQLPEIDPTQLAC